MKTTVSFPVSGPLFSTLLKTASELNLYQELIKKYTGILYFTSEQPPKSSSPPPVVSKVLPWGPWDPNSNALFTWPSPTTWISSLSSKCHSSYGTGSLTSDKNTLLGTICHPLTFCVLKLHLLSQNVNHQGRDWVAHLCSPKAPIKAPIALHK